MEWAKGRDSIFLDTADISWISTRINTQVNPELEGMVYLICLIGWLYTCTIPPCISVQCHCVILQFTSPVMPAQD